MSSHPRVVERDARKPVSSEPWRYVCPRCDGQVNGSDRTKGTYRCNQCKRTWPYARLLDRKTEMIVEYTDR